MQSAIFFDRDGVLNREIGDYVTKLEDFEVLEDAVACVKLAKDNGFLTIVITNQGGIGKGFYSHTELSQFHSKLQDACVKSGTMIDDFYYCPHHPISGNCLCRKPDSLMLEKAVAKYQIDKKSSLMIGDTLRDIQAAEKAGIRSIQVQPNSFKLRLLEEEIHKIINEKIKFA